MENVLHSSGVEDMKGKTMAKNLLTVTVKACVDDIKGLVEQLKRLQTYKVFEGDDMTLVNIDDVIEIFTNHIRAERTTSDDTVHWTPCSERLPEPESGTYWVCTDGGEQCECRWTNVNPFWTNLTTDWHWNVFDTPPHSKIIAWTYLPKPYKAESEEKE